MQNKSTYRIILYKQVYANQIYIQRYIILIGICKTNLHTEVYYINRYMQNKSTYRGILYKQVYARQIHIPRYII